MVFLIKLVEKEFNALPESITLQCKHFLDEASALKDLQELIRKKKFVRSKVIWEAHYSSLIFPFYFLVLAVD